MKRLILIESAQDDHHDEGELVVNWSLLSPPDSQISLPKIAHERSVTIKEEFLKWTHDFANAVIDGKSIKDDLKIADDFSLWWMTLIAEKCTFKTPAYFEIFKLRALEFLYADRGCTGIVLRGTDPRLASVLESFCRECGQEFTWEKTAAAGRNPPAKNASILKSLFYKLPRAFQAGAYFARQILKSIRCFFQAPKLRPACGRDGVTILTYFPNIDHAEAEAGKFRSRYWGGLHDLIESEKIPVNWVWLFAPSEQASYSSALGLARRFQNAGGARLSFSLIEQFLDFKAYWRALVLYFWLRRKGCRYVKDRGFSRIAGSKMGFHPFLVEDLKSSFSGIAGMSGVLFLAGFERMADFYKDRSSGRLIYIWEGQPWEYALTWAWRKRAGGPIIAHQHSTVAHFNLRIFFWRGDYADPTLALPDLLTANGEASLAILNEAGYPPDRRAPAEALRYAFLHGLKNRESADSAAKYKTLLVLAGYVEADACFQLELLRQAHEAGALKSYTRVLFKPHPYRPMTSLPGIPDAEVVHKPLSALFAEAGVIYCDNTTSAAIESALAGLPTIVSQSFENINQSPLAGYPDVSFVCDAGELAEALRWPKPIGLNQNYFYTSEKLSSWKRLLGH